MATPKDYLRLRRDIGADCDLPDTEINLIFEEAEEMYTSAAAIKAGARVIALQGMLASAAKLTDYDQNESSEKLSQVSKHLEKLLEIWQGRLDQALSDEASAVNPGLAPQPSSTVRLQGVW